MKSKNIGLWCPWCSMWVREEDTEDSDGLKVHSDCGNAVQLSQSTGPIVYAPIDQGRKNSIRRNADILADFIEKAK